MRHETKWTWVSTNGGVFRFDTKEGAVSHALTYGGFAIYPPIYGD